MIIKNNDIESNTDLMTFPNSNIRDCKYYTLLELAEVMKSNKRNEIMVIHFNLRSLPKNKYKIEDFLLQLPNLPHIIAVTETKLNSSNLDQAELENYHFEHIDSASNAGGVGVYIRNGLKYLLKSDIVVNSEDCENIFIEIINKPSKKRQKNILIGIIYRHPKVSFTSFQNKLCEVMLTLDPSNNSVFLLGDYNIDLSKQNIEPKVRNYINEVYSSGCCSLINKPTRITSISSTILDHVYTNSSEKVCASGILVLDVSDHLPTFCTIQNNFYKPFKLKEQVHDMKHFNAESYCEDVSYRLKKLKQLSDPSTKMSKFLDVIASATNDHAS